MASITTKIAFAALLLGAPTAAAAQAPQQAMTPSQVAIAVNTAIGQLAQQAEALQRQVAELQAKLKIAHDQLEAAKKSNPIPPPQPVQPHPEGK